MKGNGESVLVGALNAQSREIEDIRRELSMMRYFVVLVGAFVMFISVLLAIAL
jgi:hypothetical protein